MGQLANESSIRVMINMSNASVMNIHNDSHAVWQCASELCTLISQGSKKCYLPMTRSAQSRRLTRSITMAN